MARRRRWEESERHDRWLVSYADFITLLFAFFVVMYAVSSVNEGKYRVLADSLTSAFGSANPSLVRLGAVPIAVGQNQMATSNSPSLVQLPIHGEPVFAASDEAEYPMRAPGFTDPQLDRLADRLRQDLGTLIADDLVEVRHKGRRLEIEIKSSLLFTSGSARLAPAAFRLLEPVAEMLQPYANPVNVEGFTDDRPIHTSTFLSNWELSAARAASVVHLFSDYGIDPARMAAIGYGQFRPVADNLTPEGRSRNRRVVLVVLPEKPGRWYRTPDAASSANLAVPGAPETLPPS